MPTMRQLEALRAVVKHQTVTEAAKFMRLSQPAVSKLISNLEYETKLQLFERMKRRLVPTGEALILYEQAEEIFSGLREITRISGELRNLSSGRMNVVCLSALRRRFLPEILSRFLNGREGVTASFHIHSSQTVNSWIIGQQADIGISMTAIDHPAVVSQTLCRVQAVCALPNGHPLSGNSVIEAADLQDEPFISFSADTHMRQIIDHEFQSQGIDRKLTIDAYMSEPACIFVANGLGVSVVDPFTAAEFAAQGRLVVKPFRPQIAYEFRLLRPRNRPISLLAKAFSKYIQDSIDQHIAEASARVATL